MSKQKIVLLLAIPLLLLGALGAWLALFPPSSIHAVYASPSGNYKLVVHSYFRLFAAPGDASGAPGYVELLDRSGKKLAQSKLPLVLDVSSPDDVRWSEQDVSVPGVFDFPLPQP